MSSVVAPIDTARLVARLRQLVEVESPSQNKAAVDRAADLVSTWAEAMGAAVKRHQQKEYGDILELKFGPRTNRNRTLLLGHLDTVWPLGTLAQMPWREESGKGGKPGKIGGPGVLDMKSGVMMALEAIAVTQHLNLPVTLLLVSEEEIGSPVSRAVTERVAAQCARVFVLEPAQGLAYKTSRKGIGHYTLHVQGVAAHAGVDFDRGHSAVLEMSRIIQEVSAFTGTKHGLTINVGTVQGGTQSNVVAASCSAEVDVRIAKAADAKHIARLFARLKVTDKACKLTVTGGINRPPMERKPGTVSLFRTAQSIAKEMGFHLDEASTGGGSDGNFTAAIGVPTLDGMGSVGTGAHAVHENIEVAHIEERTMLLARMLAAVK